MTELEELVETARAEWREAWRTGPRRLRAEGPAAGEPAPDLELSDETGTPRRLSEFWRDAPA